MNDEIDKIIEKIKNNDNDIKVILKKKLLNELVLIGNKIGLNFNGKKKPIILESLFNYINYYSNFKKQMEIENLNNSFSTTIKDLSNKEEEITINELLFWKIFKNKFLFKKITSNFFHLNSNQGSNEYLKYGYRYNEINNIYWMLKNGYINLFKYKLVNRNESSLYYDDSEDDWFDKDTIQVWDRCILMVFNKIKNNEDYQFYKCFFNKFKRNFKSIEFIFQISVSMGCLPATKVLFEIIKFEKQQQQQTEDEEDDSMKVDSDNSDDSEEEEYIDTKIEYLKVFQESVQSGSLKMVKFIFEKRHELIQLLTLSRPLDYKLYKSNKEKIKQLDKNKDVLSYIYNQFQVLKEKKKSKISNYLYNIGFREPEELYIDEILLKLSNRDPLYSSHINYRLCELIEDSYFLNLNNKQQPQQDQAQQAQQTIKNQEKLKFTKIQLKSKIKHLLNGKVVLDCGGGGGGGGNKNDIKLILDNYYKNGGNGGKKSLFYYLIFNIIPNENEMKLCFGHNEITRNIKYSFKFGYSNYLKEIDLISSGTHSLNKIVLKHSNIWLFDDYLEKNGNNKNNNNCSILFKYCKNDLNKQIEFIKEMSFYLSNSLSPLNKMHPAMLLFLVIDFDSIELVKFTIQTMGKLLNKTNLKKSSHYYYNCKLNIFNFIKSINMLDYLLSLSSNDGLFFTLSNTSLIPLYLNGKIDLLSRLEIESNSNTIISNLFKEIISKETLKNHLSPYKRDIIYNGSFIKSFKYLLSRPELNKLIDQSFLFKCIYNSNDSNKQLSDIKFIIENTTYEYIPDLLFKNENSLNSIKLIDWILEFRKQDQKDRCKFNNNDIYSLIYKTGRSLDLIFKIILIDDHPNLEIYDKIFKNNLLNEISKRNDLKSIDEILNNNNQLSSKDKLNIFIHLLEDLTSFGKFNTIQYLLFNYSNIIICLNKIQTRNSLLNSLKNDNLEIAEFYFNCLLLQITKLKFKKKSNSIINFNFKNKNYIFTN